MNNVLKKLTDKLDSERVYDYDVEHVIPKDEISVDTNLKEIEVTLPSSNDYAQFEIDDYIRSLVPFIRVTTKTERNVTVMKVRGSLSQEQLYKLVKYIIKSQGFCVILDKP